MDPLTEAHYNITPESEAREKHRLWEKARHDEAQALHHAQQEGLQKGRQEEREKWQSVIAEKDNSIASKDAEIAKLKAQLENKNGENF